MDPDLIALTSFVMVTTFTPGPNNLSSASLGILYGYRDTLRYLAGITTGFFLVLLVCSWISATLLAMFPVFENTLRIVGAGYILWLAYHTLQASYAIKEEKPGRVGFARGFFLQLLNPKLLVYGLTLYATFMVPWMGRPGILLVSAVIFAGVAFAAISTWALFGAAIRTYLDRRSVKQALNTVLALLLVYTALELSGVLDLVRSGNLH